MKTQLLIRSMGPTKEFGYLIRSSENKTHAKLIVGFCPLK
jgi:hypothetical protein